MKTDAMQPLPNSLSCNLIYCTVLCKPPSKKHDYVLYLLHIYPLLFGIIDIQYLFLLSNTRDQFLVGKRTFQFFQLRTFFPPLIKFKFALFIYTKKKKMIINTSSSFIFPFTSVIMEEHELSKCTNNTPSKSSSAQASLDRLVVSIGCNIKLPFPYKLHQLLDDVEAAGYEGIVSWLPGGQAFRVHKPEIFSNSIMSRYFRQTKYSSFTRQLYMYGFTKIEGGANHGGFFHPEFLQGDKSASMSLTRQNNQDRRLKKHLLEKERVNMLYHGGTPTVSGAGRRSGYVEPSASFLMGLGMTTPTTPTSSSHNQATISNSTSNRPMPATGASAANHFLDLHNQGGLRHTFQALDTLATDYLSSAVACLPPAGVASPTLSSSVVPPFSESIHHYPSLDQGNATRVEAQTTGGGSFHRSNTSQGCSNFLPTSFGILSRQQQRESTDQQEATKTPQLDKLDLTIEPRRIEEMRNDSRTSPLLWQHQESVFPLKKGDHSN